MKKIVCALFVSALALCSCGNDAGADESFESTVFNADGTVTFRYRNPLAKTVQVDVQFAGRNDMALDTLTGVWTATVGPAAPDIYPYCFIVDGVSIMDPANMQYFPNEGFKNSLLDIPAPDGSALLHTARDVPHGAVDYVQYRSGAIGALNNALVYTPPSYEENSDRRYPVFYLISGTTDTEEVYYKVVRVNHILDNLIADGRAREMIVVLPYGNPAKLVGEPSTLGPGGFKDYFSEDLIGDLMPYIDSHYRTIPDADHRAIGGFSRGGNQGLMNGLMNLDKFAYLCSYSSFTSTDLPDVYDNPTTNSRIRLLWSGVGTDDFLYGNARDYTEFLDGKGIGCVKYYTDDKFGHTWMNARCFLGETLPLLFNEDAAASAMAGAQPTKARTGQEKQFTPGVMARLFPKPVVSPEIAGDSVTFRIKAVDAGSVQLAGDIPGAPLQAVVDTAGVWSVTVSGLAPDVYCYNFVVDGTEVADPQNMYLAPERGFKRSILDTAPPADSPMASLPIRYYTEGTDRVYAVVVPDLPDSQELPVVALLSGADDTFEGWHKIAGANRVLAAMLANDECRPCMLVLSDTAVPGAAQTLVSSDYATWADARRALAATLKAL